MSCFKIRAKAKDDLEKIWLYTLNKWSQVQADRYHSLILDEIEFIAENSDLSRKMDHIRAGYRMTKVKSHLIFFKQNKDYVEIIRILHQNMDIENRL